MYEYYLIGNVYKDEYVTTNRCFVSKYRGNPYLKPIYQTFYGFYVNNWEYDLRQINMSLIVNNLIESNTRYCSNIEKYKDETDYKNKHKIEERKMIAMHNWDRYEEFNTIETDIELRDGETIKIDDTDYKVLYKFNKNLKRHELYIDYEIKIEVDEELKKQCEENLAELNMKIEEYNKSIDTMVITLDERFENYIQTIKTKSFLIFKFKEWLKH